MTFPQGILFVTYADGNRRAVYEQCDGEMILASDCKCRADWVPDPEDIDFKAFNRGQRSVFVVIRSLDCPIDEHKAEYLKNHAQ
jgi:hypothetical protein